MLVVPATPLGKKDLICGEKCAKNGEKVKKLPETTGADRRKRLGKRCKVVSRATHNHRALGIFFVTRLAAPESLDKQKSCNFDRFGPSGVHSRNLYRANPKLPERARELSSSVLVVKLTCGGKNRK